jgi:hypothetical protein
MPSAPAAFAAWGGRAAARCAGRPAHLHAEGGCWAGLPDRPQSYFHLYYYNKMKLAENGV